MAYDYSQDLPAFGDNILARISGLVDEAQRYEAEIVELEEELKAAKERHRDIVQRQLPELMESAGQKECTTLKGQKVELREILRASIPKDRTAEAHAWLREHGLASIVKNVITVSLGKGQDDTAKRIADKLRLTGLSPDVAEKVHPQTLQATLREMIEEGVEFPLETFGAILQKEVKIR